jgi:hypothetical protein
MLVQIAVLNTLGSRNVLVPIPARYVGSAEGRHTHLRIAIQNWQEVVSGDSLQI